MAAGDTFNWQLLLVLLISALFSVAFLSYFNRVFASLVSWCLRTYVWHQHHVYIDVQALQFSLLGGRCFFKGLRYHGHNETILINDGYITWRYWHRRVRNAQCFNAPSNGIQQREEENGQNRGERSGTHGSGAGLPCRIKAQLRGLEWFVYNRTPAYDAIRKDLSDENRGGTGSSNSSTGIFSIEKTALGHDGDITQGTSREKAVPKAEVKARSVSPSTGSSRGSSVHDARGQESLPTFLTMLPVKIECNKAAMVMGNRGTRSVLVAKADSINGHVDAHRSRNVDLYKQMFELEFVHPEIELRLNHEFKESQVSTGVQSVTKEAQPSRLVSRADPGDNKEGLPRPLRTVFRSFIQHLVDTIRSSFRLGARRRRQSIATNADIPGHEHWRGLTRYLEDEDGIDIDHERWKAIEYGQHPTILDSPSITMNLYWDVPGLVSDSVESDDGKIYANDINGDKPPDWAVALRMNGGLISYGPWADRLRTDLQPTFFPNPYADAHAADRLLPGQRRVSTSFKLSIDIEQAATLLLPTRESSKDWKWKYDGNAETNAHVGTNHAKHPSKKRKRGQASAFSGGRPYGWIDVQIQPDSTITFNMDLVAGPSGYKNLLSLDIRHPKISSSVNHGLLLTAEAAVISCDLSNPLKWNQRRQWMIDIDAGGLELYLLRDHIFLFTDLVNDWTTGPLGDYHTFIPFAYTLNFRLMDFNFSLNANDSNVINNPASMEENTFLSIWGQELTANVDIPLLSFQPTRSRVTFDVDAQTGGFKLSSPVWNTHHVFLKSSEVATMDDLKIDGSYDYFSSTSLALTDVLRMNVHGISPKVWLYGFLVRAFMRIKENYFGDDIHFRTLEEYQKQLDNIDQLPSDRATSISRTQLSNDLDVILSITATTAQILLPSHLYSSADNVILDLPSLGFDLRFTNYYMDLDVDFSPIVVSYASLPWREGLDSPTISETQVFIDGIAIRGHRLFGLPPAEPTYVCNWDFDVGHITGECANSFIKVASAAIRCFAFTFNDAENALQSLSSNVVHDITFLRLRLQPLRVWLKTLNAALLLSIDSCSFDYNDWAKSSASERFHLHVASLVVALVDSKDLAVDKASKGTRLKTSGFLQTTLDLSTLQRNNDSTTNRQSQQQHVVRHDARTARTLWLLEGNESSQQPAPHTQPDTTVPAMPFPTMPVPLKTSDTSTISSGSTLSEVSAKIRSDVSSTKSGAFLVHVKQKGSANNVDAIKPRYLDKHVDYGHLAGYGDIDARTSDEVSGGRIDSSSTSQPKLSMLAHGMQFENPRNKISGSSSYKLPYFGLQYAQLDLSEISSWPGKAVPERISEQDRQPTSQDIERLGCYSGEEECDRTSLLIDLGQGIHGLFRTQSVKLLTSVFQELQVLEPETLLDQLQVNALEKIPNQTERSDNCAKIIETRVCIPFLRFNIVDPTGLSSDFNVDACVITAQKRSEIGSPSTESQSQPSSLAHIVLDKATMSLKVSDRQLLQDQATVMLSVQDLTAWGGTAAEMSFQAQVKEFDVKCDISQADSMTRLLECGEEVANDTRRLGAVKTRQTNRLRRFVLSMAVDGQEIPDPPFLTRASDVLRSASSRLRASDSWRMISRLRYIYQSLPLQSRVRLYSQSVSSSQSSGTSREAVVAIFGRLGMWDEDAVNHSILLNEVFGDLASSERQDLTRPVLRVSIRAEKVRVLIQPGPNQTQIQLDDTTLNSALHRSPIDAGGTPAMNYSMSVDFLCSRTAITVNLRILELLRDLNSTLAQASRPPSSDTSLKSPEQVPMRVYRYHFVLVSGANTVAVDSITIKFLYLWRPLNMSLVMRKTADDRTPGINFLASAEVATTEILSKSQIVGVGKMDRPSIFGNLDTQTTEADTASWHFAGTCTEISLKVLQDPLELCSLANRIISNEVASLRHFLSGDEAILERTVPRATPSTDIALGKPHIALFLDSYSMSFKLLPALSYRVTGRTGRISVRPGSRRPSQVCLDFDLKEHAHAFLGRSGNNIGLISEIAIPPINGRMVSSTGSSQRDVSFQSTIEHISLDAAAVHAMLVTLSRPEIETLAKSIQHESSRLFRQIASIFPSKQSEPLSSMARQTLLFDAYMTLAGLGIHTTTSTSRLDFELGLVHLKGHNRGIDSQDPLGFPEMLMSLHKLHVNLLRAVGGEERLCGSFAISATLQATSRLSKRGKLVRAYNLHSPRCETTIHTDAAPTTIDILNSLQESFRDVDLTNEVKGLQKLRRATLADLEVHVPSKHASPNETETMALFSAMYSLEMTSVQVAWKIGDFASLSPRQPVEDLVLSFTKIELTTRRDNAARLLVQGLQLQMVPATQMYSQRSQNSALLPEIVFNVTYMSTSTTRKLVFQAAGKSLDLCLTSQSILPANNLRRSIASAVESIRIATEERRKRPTQAGTQSQTWLTHKRLTSWLIDIDFAGAIVYIQGRTASDTQAVAMDLLHGRRVPQQGRYGQFQQENASSNTTLRAPGVALKVEYKDSGVETPSLNAEVKVDASSNILYPSVVPLVLEISSSVKEIMGDLDTQEPVANPKVPTSTTTEEAPSRLADPSTVFQNCTLNLGLRICNQDFSLSCQPITRVATTMHIDNIYITINSVRSNGHGQSFTMAGSLLGLQASVQHVYSRESTGGFELQSATVSLMNSKHLGVTNGISAIAQTSPIRLFVNAKQMQDFLLFREIWWPADMRKPAPAPEPPPRSDQQTYTVQRYQQIASAGVFPWNTTLSIARLDLEIDLGQSLGKSTLSISELWASSKKSSDREQNLCLAVKQARLDSTGRMSGFVKVADIQVRTGIKWPVDGESVAQAPLIQASIGYESLQVKAAFEYQAFLMLEMTNLSFLMYNVRHKRTGHSDRLVSIVHIGTVHGFCTAISSSQGLALYQAFQRLIQEKQAAYQASLKDIEKFLRRKSTVNPQVLQAAIRSTASSVRPSASDLLRLQTKVVLSIGSVKIGVFPSTFLDTQLFKLEALDAAAQFAVALQGNRLHSMLELALGQLQVSLSGVTKPQLGKSLGDVSFEGVLASANSSRGGTILKVPKVIAAMQTWQTPDSNDIDYIFKSTFQGKVDVGWNYSRIGFLRGMWNSHVRALASRLGKPLPQSALQITTAVNDNAEGSGSDKGTGREKITAVVNVPQSKYRYTPLEPPVIETPQLRDMGEATPPLEWIGLHRERLPNLTHQIVIVSLLELAREVDDAYSRILGSS
ncbi:MAG: hypothetical protein Q9220_006326 [cf. Caloplaca sp. 1 TL-2023]